MSSTEGRTLRSSTSASKRKSTDASGVGRDDEEEKIAAVGGGGDDPRPADCWSANDFRPNQRVKVYYAEGVFKATYLGHDDNGKVCVVFDGFDDEQWELDGDEGLVLIDADNDEDEDEEWEDEDEDEEWENHQQDKPRKTAKVADGEAKATARRNSKGKVKGNNTGMNSAFVGPTITEMGINIRSLLSKSFSLLSLQCFDNEWGKPRDLGYLTDKDMKIISKMQNDCLKAAEKHPFYKGNTVEKPALTSGCEFAAKGKRRPSICLFFKEQVDVGFGEGGGVKLSEPVLDGKEEVPRTIANVTSLLRVLPESSSGKITMANALQRIVPAKDSKELIPSPGSAALDASNLTYKFYRQIGSTSLVGFGNTAGPCVHLNIANESQRENGEYALLQIPCPTPFGEIAVELSVAVIKGELFIGTSAGHPSMFHLQLYKPQAYAAIAIALQRQGLCFDPIQLGEALALMTGFGADPSAAGGSNIKTGTWRVIFELRPVTKGVRHFATGAVDWDVRPTPRVSISRPAAASLHIDQSQYLSCKDIVKVSVDLGSNDKAAEALKTPSTIEWATARVVDGVKGYEGMLDVEYHDGKPYVWGGCDKDKQCVGSSDQCWQLFLLSDTAPLPAFFCAACTEKKGNLRRCLNF